MKTYDESDEFDQKCLAKLNPDPWMLDMLKLNPSYPFWGPGDDYMGGKDQGWASPMRIATWAEHDMTLNDYNEVVHFYFQIQRDSHKCTCQNGYTDEAIELRDSQFYYEPEPYTSDRGRSLTDDALVTLFKHNRLGPNRGKEDQPAPVPPITELRALAADKSLPFSFVDSISDHILMTQECERRGIAMVCPRCKGDGSIYDETPAYLALVYWLLHPRKGASRGVEVKHVEKTDLPQVYDFLAEAARRNAERFSKVVPLASKLG